MKNFISLMLLLTTTPTVAGVVEPNSLWDEREVEVCFLSSKAQLRETVVQNIKGAKKMYGFKPKFLDAQDRATVKRIVQADYTTERTHISFVGFKDCKNAPNAKLLVMKAGNRAFGILPPSFAGLGLIGESGLSERNVNGEIGMFRKSGHKSIIALKEIRKSTIVHEFGHASGLRHEHPHEESKADKNCKKVKSKEEFYITSHIVTEYDSRSIMNYCYMYAYNKELNSTSEPVLSAKDIETLRWAYP